MIWAVLYLFATCGFLIWIGPAVGSTSGWLLAAVLWPVALAVGLIIDMRRRT